MHDTRQTAESAWAEAFARLPAEAPQGDGWQRLSAALDAQGNAHAPRTRPPGRRWHPAAWLAAAAVAALAIVLPWPVARDGDPTPPDAIVATREAPDLQALYATSARLEVLLAHARDGRVASGSAAAMTAELESRVAAIDAALAQPGLPADRQAALWAERVEALEALVSFEGTRRWLAVNGAHYDGTLVQVN